MNVRPFTVPDFDPNQPAKTAELHAVRLRAVRKLPTCLRVLQSKGVASFQMSYGEQRQLVLDALPISGELALAQNVRSHGRVR